MSKRENIFKAISCAKFSKSKDLVHSLNYKGTCFEIGDAVFRRNKSYVIRGIEPLVEDVNFNCEEIDTTRINRLDCYLINGYTSNHEVITVSSLELRPVNVINVNRLNYFIKRN